MQVGDRVLVMSGEQTGVVSCTIVIQGHIMDVVTKIPEHDSGLVIHVALHDLIPHFLPGDNVKDHWSHSFSMVVTIDHEEQKVAFLDREASVEVCIPPSSTFP